MTGVYAILQNYVADFACGCGYFAVFIYREFIIGCIECAAAVYKERHDAVWICSTYGQVVFCVQCIGLNPIGIDVIGSDIRCLYLAHSHNASKSKCS